MSAAFTRRGLFGEDHDAFRDTVRRFLAAEVVPHLDAWRAAGGVPEDVWQAAGKHGFLGMTVPEQFGGGGVDDVRFVVVVAEEAMRIGAAGLALTFAWHSGVCIPLVIRHGSAGQQAAWLPGLASGELVAAPAAIGAPVPGVTLPSGIRLDGSVPDVPAGHQADLLVTAVQHEPGYVRIAVLGTDAPGLARGPVTGVLGAPDAGHADVRFESAEVPASALLSGDGPAQLRELRRDCDFWSAVLAVAGARAALSLTLGYVRDRRVFGRPVAEFENSRFRLAELAAELTMAGVFVDECVRDHAAGALTTAQAAAARLGSGAVHDLAVDQGLQLHGGYGYMREYPIAQAYADARYLRLAGAAVSPGRETLAASLGL
jgi:acyl-CoA dehydrogenase